MRQVNEHSHPVHLPDDLLTEGTQTSVLSYTTRRVADIIVAIMTEGHIYNTLAPETLNKGEVLAYCGYTAENWDTPDAYRAVMRTLFASVADLAILPIQDVLGFGADCRMNTPGEAEGNWSFRVTGSQIAEIDRYRLSRMNWLYGRRPEMAKTDAEAEKA